MKHPDSYLKACDSVQLQDGRHIICEVHYNNVLESIIVCRFKKQCYAYVNRCVHMPKRLNCEHDLLFDVTGQYLRCSMHGIIYTPETGISQSTMCNGEQLKAVKVIEVDGVVYFSDKHVTA